MWEMLQKRNKVRPSICLLYQIAVKTTIHLFLKCMCAQQTWRDMEQWLGINNLWNEVGLEDCSKIWCDKGELKFFRVVPFQVLWGIGLQEMSLFFRTYWFPLSKLLHKYVSYFNNVSLLKNLWLEDKWVKFWWTSHLLGGISIEPTKVQIPYAALEVFFISQTHIIISSKLIWVGVPITSENLWLSNICWR